MSPKVKRFSIALISSIVIILLIAGLLNYNSSKFSNNEVIAKVGKQKIYKEEFLQAWNSYFSEYDRERLPLPLQTEMKKFVLEELIKQSIVEQFIHKLDLKISDEMVIQQIKAFPQFQNSDGKFNREKFEQALKFNKVEEDEYIEQLKNIILYNIFLRIFNLEEVDLTGITQKIYENKFQQRVINLVKLPLTTPVPAVNPTAMQLKEYYDSNPDLFTTAEYRSVQLINITEKDIPEETIKVNSSEIDVEMSRFHLDKKFNITYIFTDNNTAAENVISSLKKGRSLEDLSFKVKKLNNINLRSLPFKLIEPLSALKEGETSGPIITDEGLFVIRLDKQLFLNEAEKSAMLSNIENEVKNSKIQAALEKLSVDIETTFSKTLSIDNALKHYGLSNIVLDNLENSNTTITKNKELNSEIIKRIFETPLEKLMFYRNIKQPKTITGIYVTKITAPEVLKLENNEGIVKEKWNTNYTIEKLKQMVIEKATKSSVPKNLVTLASPELANMQKIVQTYPEAFINEVFSLKEKALTAPFIYENNVCLGVLQQVIKPKKNSIQEEQISKILKENLTASLLEEFIFYALKSIKVERFLKVN